MPQLKIIDMPIAELRPHPLQGDFFSDLDDADEAALSADLRANGQRDPIDLMPPGNAAGLPAGTILDGHQRVRLLKAAGHTAVRVRVRHDLKDATAASVGAIFLGYNSSRRHMTSLQEARIAWRSYELECGRDYRRMYNGERTELKKRVGKSIGIGVRNMDRYIGVLRAPFPIQQAVDQRRLKLDDGARIAGLDQAVQQEIAGKIAGVADKAEVRRIVGAYIKFSDPKRHSNASNAFGTLVRHLKAGLADLNGREKAVSPYLAKYERETLRQTRKLVDKLLERASKAGKTKSIEELFAPLERSKVQIA